MIVNIMKYVKCEFCEINYIPETEVCCDVCKQNGKFKRTDGYFNPLRKHKSVCYNCHTIVDSDSDKYCEKCNWLICSVCGACGCTEISK